MENSTTSKKKIDAAVNKALKSKERHCVYLRLEEANCSAEISSHSKKEEKLHSQVYTVYDSVQKIKELWIDSSGKIYIKEEVFGKKLNRPHEIIKTNHYDTFIMNWTNGDYIQIVHGRITSTKLS